MDMPTSGKEIQSTEAPTDGQEKNTRAVTRTPSIVVGIVAAIVVALSVFYLLRPEPLLVQGERVSTGGSRKYPSNVARAFLQGLCSYASIIPKLLPNTGK
jgi:hypothetical protein